MTGEKLIFSVMVLCVVCSAMILNFSYGLFQNTHTAKNEAEIELKDLNPTFAEGSTLTKGDIRNYSEALSPALLDAIEVIFCTAKLDEFPWDPNGDFPTMYMRYSIRNGQYHVSEPTRKAFEEKGQLTTGRYITDQEEAAGECVAIISNYREENQALMTEDRKLKLFGKEYTIIGRYSGGGGGCPIVPFLSVPDELPVFRLGFLFYQNITRSQYQELISTAERILPGQLVFEELPFPDDDQKYLYNNILLISVLISVLSAANLAIVYLYMIKKRSRDLSVFRVCGFTRTQAVRCYLGECLFISVPVYLIGTGLYILLLKRVLVHIFPYIGQAYSLKVYLAIFALYILTIVLIMGIVIRSRVGRTVMDGLKGGQG